MEWAIGSDDIMMGILFPVENSPIGLPAPLHVCNQCATEHAVYYLVIYLFNYILKAHIFYRYKNRNFFSSFRQLNKLLVQRYREKSKVLHMQQQV